MDRIISITPNTGGLVTPDHIIGRDKEIKRFWEVLKKQGIALFAERRFGKSSILRKMEADVIDGFVAVYQPVEGVVTPGNLANVLLDKIKGMNLVDESLFKKIENHYNKATELVEEIKGIKLKKLEYSWQKKLFYLLQKLVEKHQEKVIVIMLDEFSIFLDNLSKNEASVVIGFFRNITFEKGFENIRFIYCGSIGIDLVLDKIRNEGHNIGDPLNHMSKQELSPFTEENALYFGKCLNLGCELNMSVELLNSICKRSDNIPYFIDIVIDKVSKSKEPNQESIDKIFDEIIDDTSGKESIKHFYDRIENFYPNHKISIYILNFISISKHPPTEVEIANYLFTVTTQTDRIEINKEIERLKNDGYLIRSIVKEERIFDFKYSLLKSWWKRNKSFK